MLNFLLLFAILYLYYLYVYIHLYNIPGFRKGDEGKIFMAVSIKMSDARSHLAELANEVEFKKKRVSIQRHGKTSFALVSAEDLELLENFRKVLAVSLTKRALKKGKFVSIEEIDKKIAGS